MTAAIYCRLSREDEEKQSESESIQNQKSMLIKYALDKGWDIYNIYCDEDYSGIDRERPAFRQLIADAEARQFDIVLVKTQSRFTRDMELVEKYIHGLFAEWGIRFVATVDNVDTDIKGNKKRGRSTALSTSGIWKTYRKISVLCSTTSAGRDNTSEGSRFTATGKTRRIKIS